MRLGHAVVGGWRLSVLLLQKGRPGSDLPERRLGPIYDSPTYPALCRVPDYAEDFKQGAMFEKAADTRAADGTLLKIPLC